MQGTESERKNERKNERKTLRVVGAYIGRLLDRASTFGRLRATKLIHMAFENGKIHHI